MPYIPVSDTVMAELFMIWDSQLIETVLHFSPVVAGYNLAQMGDLGDALVTWWGTNIKPGMPTTLSLSGVKITDMASETGPVVDVSTGLPVIGTNASPSLPNNVACVFTKRTALRGRSYRGRIYHPGLCESMVTGNTVLASQVTTNITAYNLLRSFTANTKVWKLQVVSRRFEGADRLTGVTEPVTGFTSDGVVDSQRRRLPGRGS